MLRSELEVRRGAAGHDFLPSTPSQAARAALESEVDPDALIGSCSLEPLGISALSSAAAG